MILSCPECRTRYVVPDTAVGPNGRQVRCASCRHSWFQEPPLLDLVARVEADTTRALVIEAPATRPIVAEPARLPPVHPIAVEPVAAPPAPETPDYDAFVPAPPFRPRRNPARLWTLAAALAAVVLLGGIGVLHYLGTPTWLARLGLPVGAADVPLLVQMPQKPIRRTMPSGNELFELSGRVINPTNTVQRVPDIQIELSDAQGRVVYGWTVTPSKRTLAARESLNFDSAQIDVPKGAQKIDFLLSGDTAK